MDKNIFTKFVDNFKNEITNNMVLKDAIYQEEFSGNFIKITNCFKQIEYTKDLIDNNDFYINYSNLALMYNGNPNVLIHILLNAVFFNFNLTLYADSYLKFQACLTKIAKVLLEEYNMKLRIQIIDNKREQHLKDNQNTFDKIIYVGDYFNFKNLQYYITTTMQFSSYGHIKVYAGDSNIDSELTKFAYMNNIELEIYENFDEFFAELNNDDDIICLDKEKLSLLEKLDSPTLHIYNLEKLKSGYICQFSLNH